MRSRTPVGVVQGGVGPPVGLLPKTPPLQTGDRGVAEDDGHKVAGIIIEQILVGCVDIEFGDFDVEAEAAKAVEQCQ